MSNTINLGAMLMEIGQLEAEIRFNDFAFQADAFLGTPVFLGNGESDPPTSPSDGDMYLLADTGLTGAFVGHEGEIALYYSGWVFFPPFAMIAFDWDANGWIKYNPKSGGSWSTAAI